MVCSAALMSCGLEGHDERVEVVPNECATCHLIDYEATTMPEHAGVFPTLCEVCHFTESWAPAMGDGHPSESFPIDGTHNFECTECHNIELGTSEDGRNTDCVGCHIGTHQKAVTDRDHADVFGYPFDDTTTNFCISCHPDGSN